MKRILVCVIFVVVAVLSLPSCATKKPVPALKNKENGADIEAVRYLSAELSTFHDHFISCIDDTAMKIAGRSTTRRERTAVARWRLLLVSMLKGISSSEDPQACLIDTWAFCARVRQYMVLGDGSSLFADNQQLATDTVIQLENRIVLLAKEQFSENEFKSVSLSVQTYIKENPLTQDYSSRSVVPFSRVSAGNAAMSILRAPLAGLKSLGGITNTPRDVHRLTSTAQQFADVVEELPASARWQTQLLLAELRDAEAVDSALQSFELLSSSVHDMRVAMKELPGLIRVETVALMNEVEARQTELRKTIDRVQALLDASDASLSRVESIADTAPQWTQNVNAIRDLVADIRSLACEEQKDRLHSRPFDVTEYTEAASRIAEGAGKVQAVLAELDRMLYSPDFDRRLESVQKETTTAIDSTSGRLSALTDQVTWRVVTIIAVFFTFLAAYRLVVSRWLQTHS